MLATMPDLNWRVIVKPWTWIYSFSRLGTVTWRDPYNGMNGKGTWKFEPGRMITKWVNSKTWEEWDAPISTTEATGKAHMSDGTTRDLRAVPLNWFLEPGDVVYAGEQMVNSSIQAAVIYADEVRTGGTVAWICRNPGNIKQSPSLFAEKHGAFKGKIFPVPGVYGGFAIFPSEQKGLMAVVALLRGYGPVTIRQAMALYAKAGEGKNDPELYAAILARGLQVDANTKLSTFTDQQVSRMAALITGVETTRAGLTYSRDDDRLPYAIQTRLR